MFLRGSLGSSRAPWPAPPGTQQQPYPAGFRAALGTLAGFVLLAVSNALAIAALPWPAGGLRVRLLHHAFDAAGVIGLGVVAAVIVGLGTEIVERSDQGAQARLWRAIGLLVFGALAAALMYEIVGRDLRRQAVQVWNGRLEQPLLALYVAGSGLALPASHAVGLRLARARLLPVRLVPLALALAAILVDHLILRDDYYGTHGAVAWAAATLAGAGAASHLEVLARRRSRRAVLAGTAAVVLVGVLGLAVPPSDSVRVELFREPCAISAWALARTVWSLPGPAPAPPAPGELAAGAPDSPWWRDRRALAPIPPTAPPLLAGKPPVVVLLTIDAVRADAIADPVNARRFPALAELQRTGATFARATSPGSQTAVSLSAMFSGRYFSQLVWDYHGQGIMRFPYPAEDPARRFPEILAEHGVLTASYCGTNFLASEYGVARGFTEETVIPRGREHARAAEVITPLLARLRRAGKGPLFLFAHLMEPHAPYDRGGIQGTAWERYLAEIQVADAKIGELAKLLAQRFRDRGYLIISSDHGEAFGEHGTFEHTKTIYEELVRVPLLVRGPGIAAHRIDQRVGLIDLGPTILDLFGVETPPEFMGQSLVPLLAGRDASLDRPLLAEGRLRRALYWGDLKVIDDTRRKLVEVYDLQQDPAEARNLFDLDPARVDPALAALRAFFATHRAWKPGYVPMYKP